MGTAIKYKVYDKEGEEYSYFKSIDMAYGFILGLLTCDKYLSQRYTTADFEIVEEIVPDLGSWEIRAKITRLEVSK